MSGPGVAVFVKSLSYVTIFAPAYLVSLQIQFSSLQHIHAGRRPFSWCRPPPTKLARSIWHEHFEGMIVSLAKCPVLRLSNYCRLNHCSSYHLASSSCLLLQKRTFHRHRVLRTPLPSAERTLREALEKTGSLKWGWIFYRTTYSKHSETAWPIFTAIFNQYTQNLIGSTSKASDSENVSILRASVEHSFVSNRATLENATRAQLRDLHKAWAPRAATEESALAKEDPRWLRLVNIARYCTFIQVDEASLRSVIEETPFPAPLRDIGECNGHVNLVDARWKPDPDHDQLSEPEDRYEEIDGVTKENVGWMKLHASLVSYYFYLEVGTEWYDYYKRPPELTVWS